MRFRALAVDYDGTIAQDWVLNPELRDAIGEAPARGIVVVLVTGRILSDLRQVAGNLDFVDAVVAENGAVREFPNRYSRLIGSPPPAVLLGELRRHGVEFTTGHYIMEADAKFSAQILTAHRELALPLMLLFNRRRLMVFRKAVARAIASIGLLRRTMSYHPRTFCKCERNRVQADASSIGGGISFSFFGYPLAFNDRPRSAP